MNRYLSIILSGVFSLAVHAVAAQEQDNVNYHSCDFTEGIPDDYTTIDRDGQMLHYTMVQAGIKQGEAWARKREVGKDNYYAMSACRYKEIEGEELRPSDDWLITPCIWVRGRDARLTWRSISVKNLLTVGAGYEVLISTTGNSPEDFSTILFTTPEEQIGEWNRHEVDLSDYEGQHVYIAFHNNSSQGEILGIDDVLIAGHRGVCDMEVTTGTHIYGTHQLAVSTAITSYNDSPITHMTLYYRHGDNVVTETLDNLNIAKYETYHYTFPTTIPVEYSDTVSYTVGATVQDIEQDAIDCKTVAFAFKTTRKSVIEESTGMWCTYCPKGIVAMERVEHKYPEQFIGLALHTNDFLAVEDYVSDLGFPEGFPTAWINRRTYVVDLMVEVENNGRKELVADNGGLETAFVNEKDRVATTDVAITHIDTYNNTITIDAVTRPAIDIDNVSYNLAYVIVEDNVWQDGYYQSNTFSGSEPYLEGWYERPNPIISDYAFNHVVRTIYNNYQGIEGSLPAQFVAGEEYATSHTFDLPSTILNIDNVKVVAMIIDRESGEIINACESSVLASVEEPEAQSDDYCYVSGNELHVVLSQPTHARINVYAASGTLVATCSTQQLHTQLPLSNEGVYVVTITHDNRLTTHKVVVR